MGLDRADQLSALLCNLRAFPAPLVATQRPVWYTQRVNFQITSESSHGLSAVGLFGVFANVRS